jgi:penicillin-binding protein 1A
VADLEQLPPGGPSAYARPRLKKLRLALLLAGVGVLAIVSTVFGMMMAVASDLPQLENKQEYRQARNSVLYADDGKAIAKLTGNENRILVAGKDVSPMVKNAVIAIEDRRFYQHGGVDYKGIARAFFQDVLRRKAAQGGSTITQQFVKNALSAQGDRTVFQKLREAALAYHLERRWSKQKVLEQYMNTVYFGNGAYGVESAMRTYFGSEPETLQPAATGAPQGSDGFSNEVVSRHATPAEAALLAGIIASPSRYDPVQNPVEARKRRDLVLDRMLDQKMITRAEHDKAVITKIPAPREVRPPRPDSSQPYFSTWLTQQLVDRYRAGRVFSGGLKVRTTLDPELQAAAQAAISRRLTGIGPTAALVAIENKTGAVRAMVGGTDFERRPFNLATNGHRQPGSSFKAFTLIAALEEGVSPEATFASQRKVFPVPNSRTEKFVVNNYEDQYSGISSLRSATARSDNSVYAELGLKVGTEKIADLAQEMGVRTKVSTNPAMTLGGLSQGLTPLELAYAYSTIANKGVRVSGSLGSEAGPVGVERVDGSGIDARNNVRRERVFPEQIGETAQQLLAGVVQGGTGKSAQIGEFAAGKTGTTENYGDAWFVGFNKELTVAVWVGYPDRLHQMKTEYHGSPVAGGTFPTEIWHDFMASWINIREQRDLADGKDDTDTVPQLPTGPAAPGGTTPETFTTPEQAPDEEGQRENRGDPAPREPQQPPETPDTPATPPPAPPGTGGGGGGATPSDG